MAAVTRTSFTPLDILHKGGYAKAVYLLSVDAMGKGKASCIAFGGPKKGL